MKRTRAPVLICIACVTRLAQPVSAQVPPCPQVQVVDCPEATANLASLVQAQCLQGDHVIRNANSDANTHAARDPVSVRVAEGSCESPVLLHLRVDGRGSELAVADTRAHWRFVALAIVETLRARAGSAENTAGVQALSTPPEPGPSPWVDPRPVATAIEREAWLPHYAGLDDTGRGATSMALRLGVAGADGGIAGMGSLSLRHRFEAPWTLGVEVPAVLARLDGEGAHLVGAALRGGFDAHYGSVELSLGVTPSRGLRPGDFAPSAGLRLRLGVEDGIGVRLAFEGLYADGVKVQRVMLRIQGLILRRFRVYSQLEGLFASGFFFARVGMDVWLVGRGDSGSWSLGADLGAALLRYERSCEMGACAMGEDASLSAPAAHLRLEVRL